MERQSTGDRRVSKRAGLLLAVGVAALLAALIAVPLALRARAHSHAAQALVTGDLVLVQAVSETRALTADLALQVSRAASRPGDRLTADRFRSDRELVADELRRVRLYAHDRDTVDVADDLENSLLRYDTAAARVFAAALAGKGEQARMALAAGDADASEAHDLAEELVTHAFTQAEIGGRAVSGGGRAFALGVVALVALLIAGEALLAAWVDSGEAIAAALAGIRRERKPVVAGLLEDAGAESEVAGAEVEAPVEAEPEFDLEAWQSAYGDRDDDGDANVESPAPTEDEDPVMWFASGDGEGGAGEGEGDATFDSAA